MPKEKTETKQTKVIINDDYYFTIDGRSMTLFKKGTRDAIGYFTNYEQMFKRIIHLNSVDLALKEEDITIIRYLEIFKQERERIEKLFEAGEARHSGF